MAIVQIGDQFWDIQSEDPEKNIIWVTRNGEELKLTKEASAWVISGAPSTSSPQVVHIFRFPFDLIDIDDYLLYEFLPYLQIEPGEQFWMNRLERHYGKKIIESRPTGMSAKQQSLELFLVQRVLDSPLFNRNYSDLETKLPLEVITYEDRIDLMMLLPLNLITKYENLKYRLSRDNKIRVLSWLHSIDPRF